MMIFIFISMPISPANIANINLKNIKNTEVNSYIMIIINNIKNNRIYNGAITYIQFKKY